MSAAARMPAAALWMTAIDLVIDPLAANQLGYCRWVQSGRDYGIPWQNFIGWFVVSFIIFSGFRRRVWMWEKNRTARYVGLSIVLFFTVIAFSYGLVLAGGVGVGLSLAHLALPNQYRER